MIAIPSNALPGITRMRVILVQDGIITGPCMNIMNGEAEDYLVDIQAALPCTNPPIAGVITSLNSSLAVCPGKAITLMAATADYGAGITYQWYSAPTATGAWTAIAGATANRYIASPSTPTHYRLEVRCSGGSVVYTPSVEVTINTFINCYCAGYVVLPKGSDIFNVTLGTLNQSSTCLTTGTGTTSSLNQYSDYTVGTNAPAAPLLSKGVPINFSIEVGTCSFPSYDAIIGWIDYNHNSIFEASEVFYSMTTTIPGPHTESGVMTVPASALAGLTRMRIITAPDYLPAPCEYVPWGEIEDYLVEIAPSVATQNPVNLAQINLFPNPTEGKFSLDIQLGSPDNVTVKVMSVTGELITEQTAVNIQNKRLELDLSTVPAGLYFVHVATNSESKTLKVIVTR